MAPATVFASLVPPSPSCSSSPLRQRRNRGGDAVYVASVPLRATPGPPQLLLSAAHSLGLWDLQHFMVIVSPNGTFRQSQSPQAFVFDFQPQDPENVYAAISALSGRQVPGIILKRTVSRLPKKRCWLVGYAHADGVEVADTFNEGWSTDLIIGKHDCRHYTEGLVQSLTGESGVLHLLKATSRKESSFREVTG